MSRVLLVVALAVASVSCSKSKDEAAASQPQPGEAAGKVLEVAGKVTVAGKPLAVGDALKADDVIETGADGRVVVELTHNLAHWELGANKQQKVSDSIAWKLPRDEGNAKVVIQDMSSAGRPAERSAADTSVSANAPAQGSAAPTAPPPPATQPAPHAPKSEPAHRSAAPADTGRADKLAAPAKTESAPAPDSSPHLRGGSMSKQDAADIVEAQEPALRACLGPGDHVEIHVKVDASGKATTTIDGASKASVKSCLLGVIGKLKLPAEKASVNVTIDKSAN
ncbi:MAG: hypothetical protein ACM31C_06010 [Acidobacteriota bacterium]